MAYKAPIWEDGKSPAISAENLNNLSQAAEGAQVLYGNSAPTSSTEGAVGQFYLVVVADSDGNYPLYQCVAIANGSYVWRDTRRIPNSITSMLGIPAPGTINSALNVLAHVGNLHVWERVQTVTDPIPEVPAGYTLGAVETDVVVSNQYASNYNLPFDYATELNISSDGTISLKNPSTREVTIADFGQSWVYSNLAGHFFVLKSSVALERFRDVIWYMPEDGTASVSESGSVSIVTLSKMQSVSFRPYTPAIPAGTTTDYLTSTDRNAYPDKSSDGSSYLLGESESKQVSEYYDTGTTRYLNLSYSDSVVISGDGSRVELNNPTTVEIGANASANFNVAKGKFCKFFQTSDTSVTVSITDLVFIPSDAEFLLTYPNSRYTVTCSKVQSVIVVPRTITYLGQLGEPGVNIEMCSYVGTGTRGSSNPCSITSERPIFALHFVGYVSGSGSLINNRTSTINIPNTYANFLSTEFVSTRAFGNNYGKKSSDGKTFYWYSSAASSDTAISNQLNIEGCTYYFLIINLQEV